MEPARAARASAPGKVILFGEHAVVYGEPSLSLAIDRRVRVTVRPAERRTLNGEPLDLARHAYVGQAVDLAWGDAGIAVDTVSELPPSGGVGSSAALCVATVGALERLRGTPVDVSKVARLAFEAEYATQGAASPNDTSVSTAGGAVLLAPRPLTNTDLLWQITRDQRTWAIHRVGLPSLPLVVAHSGQRGRTSEQVAKVRRFLEKNAFARDMVREIGRITLEGVDAIKAGDLARVGSLMDRNHALLHTLGVDTPQLANLCARARKVPGTFGAKLTGAGGGGSMIALTRHPDAVVKALQAEGASAMQVRVAATGLEVDP